MIIDHIKHIGFYEPMAVGITAAWKEIQQMLQEKGELSDGRYELNSVPDGFFKVQHGTTKPLSEGTFESHKRYIDVQILLDGQEEMAWMELADLTEAIPYDAEKDAARWDGERTHHMTISKDIFYIAYPHDGHKAVSHVDEPHVFTKIILKLPV